MIMFIVVILLCFLSLLLVLLILINQSNIIISMKIFNVNFFGDFEILINIWSVLFLLMVFIISTSVMVFSISYMSSLKVSSFIFLYLSFVFSMMWLILNNNFYWMMFGWDGLGVVSFLLIVFYMNYESINNGLFTLFQNRIGDLFFVLFILGSMQLCMWNNLVLHWGILFLLIGSCVKSAQFPFNAWLLSAMSAPTPISSLVHSSTLVVAGVYILLQFSYCLVDVLEIMKIISIMSLILSSFGLLTEFDMKKLIAYSTMNHVSLMLYMLSFKLYKVVYFHLNIHAMFKSLMFMCFGFVMLSSFHSQDKRLVTLVNLNPLVKIVYYFSCMCLAGLPFLSAFFSKDFMIEKVMEDSFEFLYVYILLIFLSTSIYYSLKLLNLSFYQFSYALFEKNSLGMISVFMMLVIMISLVNVYISLVFSLSLELFSYKMYVYILVCVLAIYSLTTNINYKVSSYDKMKNFKESWTLKVSLIDNFIYWNIFVAMSKISSFMSIKLFLLMNWWVMILFIVLFYNVSCVSVALKKLSFYYIFYGVLHVLFSLMSFS